MVLVVLVLTCAVLAIILNGLVVAEVAVVAKVIICVV